MPFSLVVFFKAVLLLTYDYSAALKRREVRLGDEVVIPCEMSHHQKIHWLRMGPEAQPKLLMITSLKNDGDMTILHPSNNSNLVGCVLDRLIGLKVLRVAEQDLGTYFCASSEPHLTFGKGLEIYTTVNRSQEQQDQNHMDCIPAQNTLNAGTDSFSAHVIMSVVMSIGLMIMVLTIAFVHMKTSRPPPRKPRRNV